MTPDTRHPTNVIPSHLSAEADRISRQDARSHGGLTPIPRDEEIRPQPAEAYRPPAFLAKTATPAQVEELARLLSRLREVNDEHAGENTLESQVYYVVTGLGRELEEGFRRWCEGYFLARADSRHVNPQVGNDPFLLFEKRLGEVDDLMGVLSEREHTLNSTFVNLSLEFVPWLLYERLWKGLVRVIRVDDRVEFTPVPPYQPAPDAFQRMCVWFWEKGWADSHLDEFLGRLAVAVDPARLAATAAWTDRRLRADLAAMAADIREMRPLLVRGYKARKTALALGDGVAPAWCWSVHFVAATLSVGVSKGEAAGPAAGHDHRTGLAVGFNAALLADAAKGSKVWGTLSRHLHFGMKGDLDDIVRADWPAVRRWLEKVLSGEDDPLPVPVEDLGDLVRSRPSGPLVIELQWARLDAAGFERLIYNLICKIRGYENARWLTHTNASDKGRDLSVDRVHEDELAGTRRERAVIACRHWLSRATGVAEASVLKSQMSLHEPPRVDLLVVATSGRFTGDAVQWIEKHNQSHEALMIEMWPGSHLEMLLARRPDLIAEFNLR
jgi:hypothetical protein